MKTLYKWTLEYPKCNDKITSVFVSDDKILKNSLGKHVYIGEAGTLRQLEQSQFFIVSQDPHVCEIFETHVGVVGYNPLDYIK